MVGKDRVTLEQKLAQKEKELELILAIDRIRDATTGIGKMLSAIINVVVEELEAELGLVGLVLFSSPEGPLWKRLLKGFSGLTGLSNAFGDALSYLRLFALGLASASLAGTFNAMAGQAKEALPGIGILFALMIALLGHTLNFVLALSSGFIHGLRLNFIEFFI